MSSTASAIIKADVPNPPSIYSKYRVESSFKDGDSPAQAVLLNINADIAVPKFTSSGAADGKKALKLAYNSPADVTGFARFNGFIGAGQIQITTNKGVTIKGPIEGGPEENQAWVGSGTWTIA